MEHRRSGSSCQRPGGCSGDGVFVDSHEIRRIISLFLAFSLLLISCAVSSRRVGKKRYKKHARGVYHPVKKGETLWRIARTYGVNLKELQRVNLIRDPNDINVGDRIFIPGAKHIRKIHVVSPATATVTKRSFKKKRLRREQKKVSPPSSAKRKNNPVFVWPVKGTVTSLFGFRKSGQRHDGLDIAAPGGTLIYAARSGKVIYADNRLRYYGKTIILKHSNRYFSVYAHNKKNLVSVGAWVKRGERIARVGDSGRANGTHLHFEIRRKDKPVDPLLFLPKR